MLASARARGAPRALPSTRWLLLLGLAAVPGCEDLRVAAGARDLLAHYQRCKLLEADGPLRRDGEGRIDVARAGQGSARCRQGKALVTVRVDAVEAARAEILGPRSLGSTETGTYHLRATDAEGRSLRVGRVAWELGAELAPVPRCPKDLPTCPDFLDSIELRLVEGARAGVLRACLTRCVELTIRPRR